MKLFDKILKIAIDKAKKSKLVQSAFEAPIELSSFPEFGTFRDNFGNTHTLFRGLREKIKPGSEHVAIKMTGERIYTGAEIARIAENSRIIAGKIWPIIDSFKQSNPPLQILEIGCHSGGVSYALAEKGAIVAGTEFSDYKIESVDNEIKQIEQINKSLSDLREQIKKHFTIRQQIKFYDDDICNSQLPSSTYDVVCSWDVLEHLNEPEKAFKQIFRLLKPGCIAIHEYNPFFSLNGGHSLCTLDFLWGHVRLDKADFTEYIKKYRPKEEKAALSFYSQGLNRMALDDLINISKQAKLDIIGLFCFTKEQHIRMLSHEIWSQSRKIYPQLKAHDLTTPKILVIQQKQ
ncbi:MAG: class I SAM-dependent methyltransferase [Bacteroidia bacterium]|nr:class I SAM-dependent methyltransferase [Bacteroidia bacterium]